MQGFNMGRYYPPDASNPPRFNTTHPLGARANKSSQGILTVRFELPFAVWCAHCKPRAIVGQGVRFNAEKKKIGNYYTTPIWSFRMKHSACGGWWEIRTDPQSAEYVVHEGATRRDYGASKAEEEEEGDLKFLTEEQREKRRTDAFAGLEGKVEEKSRMLGDEKRLGELYEGAETWRDPYEVNARLRREFRARRKVWKEEERFKEGMQERFSLGMDIADEEEGDRVRAKLVEFGGGATSEDGVDEVVRKPLFAEKQMQAVVGSVKGAKKLKAEVKAEQSRQGLQQTLVENSRATIDPFLSVDAKTSSKMNLGILKRKRYAEPVPHATTTMPTTSTVTKKPGNPESDTSAKKPAPLVDYDSD